MKKEMEGGVLYCYMHSFAGGLFGHLGAIGLVFHITGSSIDKLNINYQFIVY